MLKITIPISINILILTILIKEENHVTKFHSYSMTIIYWMNLVSRSIVYIMNNFYLWAKDDKMLLKNARLEDAIPTLLTPNNIYS
jgi:hypothetical protein